jgi:hypothetical protein
MRRRTPQEKKRLEYDRDRFVEAENPHLFRKGWPKKKARTSRRDRRRAERLLEGIRNRPADAVVEHADDVALTAEHVGSVRPGRSLWKAGILTVRERVAHRKLQRVNRTGFHFFSRDYESAEHRKPFAAFLASLVAGAGPGSDAMAEHLADLLDGRVHNPYTDHWRLRRRAWLRAFFRDEQEWEPRLRKWLDARLSKSDDRAPGGGAS